MSDRRASDRHSAAPPGAAEELTAALEAASGKRCRISWNDPMEPEEVKAALDRLLTTRRPDRGLEVLVRSGVMEAILPEVSALVGFGEGVRHKDVWEHTKKVVLRVPPRLDLRWAALVHDIGKVPTRRFEPDGQVTFIAHPEVGARMFDRIARRLPFAEESRGRIRLLVAAHLRASAYGEDWTDSAVRRFARDLGDAVEDLFDLSRADITSKHAEKVRRGIRVIERLAERLGEVREADARVAPLPKGLGTAIAKRAGMAPGPWLGRIMRALEDAVEAGRLGPRESYEHYLSYIDGNPSLLGGAREEDGS